MFLQKSKTTSKNTLPSDPENTTVVFNIALILFTPLFVIFGVIYREYHGNSKMLPVQHIQKESYFTGGIWSSDTVVGSGEVQEVAVNISSQYVQNDSSIVKYLSPEISFDEKTYIPAGLVSIEPSKTISFSKSMQIRKDILPFFQEMSEAFFVEFKKPIYIVSAYRDYTYQARIEKNNQQCIADRFCARAGHSEHQTGLTFDFFEASDKDSFMANPTYAAYYFWLKNNAYKYGFTQSYQKGKEIDGYHVEPWHWRYVGKDLARELHEQDITFSEWYNRHFSDKLQNSHATGSTGNTMK